MSQSTLTLPVAPPAPRDADGVCTMQLGRGQHVFKFIDYASPTPAMLDELQQQYNFHPLAMEDLRTYDSRAKVLDFDSYLFLTLRSLTRADGEIKDHELDVFLARDYLITVHSEPLPEIDVALKRFLGDPTRQDLGPDFLLYLILDETTNALFPMIDAMDEDIDRIEEETIDRATPQTLKEIFKLKHDFIQMRRSVAPMRDVMIALAGTRFELIDHRTALYYRDVYDRLSRIYELIETARDLLSNALDTYLSVQNNNMNLVMKRLTLIATIFLPLSFIVGWGGMNFDQMPFHGSYMFWVVNVALIAVPVGMWLYFRKKNWY